MTSQAEGYSVTPRAAAPNIVRGTDGDDYIDDISEPLSDDDVVYAGAGNDTIIDGHGSDTTFAGAGDDVWLFDDWHNDFETVTAYLEDGNDSAFFTLIGQSGTTRIDGGEGFDTLYAAARNMNVGVPTLDFRTSEVAISSNITIIGFERVWLDDTDIIQKVYFGENGDYFRGWGNFNTVYGGGGDDFIWSGQQGDRLYGGDGNDIIISDAGTTANPHHVEGGAGNDLIFSGFKYADYYSHATLVGGTGSDGFVYSLAHYALGDQEDHVTDFDPTQDWIGLGTDRQDPQVTQRLATPKYNVTSNSEQLSFDVKYGAEGVVIHVRYDKKTGGLYVFNSVHQQEYLSLVLEGTPDIDIDNFYIMSSQVHTPFDDILHGNEMGNHLEGAGGSDTIYGLGGDDLLYGDGADHFGHPGAGDMIFGGNGNDVVGGDEGNDYLFGNSGKDTIDGGLGDDVLDGGTNTDKLIGGSGKDTASYAKSQTAVVANLALPATNVGEAKGDTYSSIENLIGSNFADVLTGDGAANAISGGGGSDTLSGGEGNDVLNGGSGADRLIGSGGTDTASYAGATKGVVANLKYSSGNMNDAKGDVYSSIENLTGSVHADALKGNDAANRISAGSGNDILYGLFGNDLLVGGLGADAFVFDTKLQPGNIDTIDDFIASDDTIWLNRSIFTRLGGAGDLATQSFYAGATAHDGSDRIIYDKATGKLFYDADGTGSGAAVQFALLDKNLTLTASDFDIIA
jgi:Ca2+-binding RTX toxin-like protein